MNLPARALSVALPIWLTAVSSVPVCCWSITSSTSETAHHHGGAVAKPDVQPPVSESHAHHHAQNAGGDEREFMTPTMASSANSSIDCTGIAIVAIATSTPFRLLGSDTVSGEPVAFGFLPAEVRNVNVAPCDISPPGSVSDSAFLNPLRL